MAGVFIGLRVHFMGTEVPEFAPADNPAADSDSIVTRTLTFLYLPACNMWLLAYPRTLSFDWSMDAVPLIESLADFRNLWTLVFYAAITYATSLLLRVNNHDRTSSRKYKPTSNGYANHCTTSTTTNKGSVHRRFMRRPSISSTESEDSTKHSRQQNPITSLHVIIISLAILVFPFVPASNLFFYVGFVIAERVLYIPSMGYCLLLAHGVCTLHRTRCENVVARRLFVGAFVCIILTYSARTVVRNQDWLSEENLYKSGIKVNPAKGNIVICISYSSLGDWFFLNV